MEHHKPLPRHLNVIKKIEAMLCYADTIRSNQKYLKPVLRSSLKGWKNLVKVDRDDIRMFKLKSSTKAPSFGKYLNRLLSIGKFDPEVYIMSAFIMKKFIELLHPSFKIKDYALKLFAVSVLVSHKYLMDNTWKLDDASKILGFGKNALQQMEFDLYQIIDYRLAFRERERKETIYWLCNVERLIESLQEVERMAFY